MQFNPSLPRLLFPMQFHEYKTRLSSPLAIDVTHPMTILRFSGSFLGWVFMDLHQWSPNRHGIYGLPPMVPRTPTHFMGSYTNGSAYPNHRVSHPRDSLALLANPDPILFHATVRLSRMFNPTFPSPPIIHLRGVDVNHSYPLYAMSPCICNVMHHCYNNIVPNM